MWCHTPPHLHFCLWGSMQPFASYNHPKGLDQNFSRQMTGKPVNIWVCFPVKTGFFPVTNKSPVTITWFFQTRYNHVFEKTVRHKTVRYNHPEGLDQNLPRYQMTGIKTRQMNDVFSRRQVISYCHKQISSPSGRSIIKRPANVPSMNSSRAQRDWT